MARGDRERFGGGGNGGLSQVDIDERRDNLPPFNQRNITGFLKPRTEINPASTASEDASSRAESFVPLADTSWAAHAALIKDESYRLGFDASRLFDGIVAAKSGLRGLYDPDHRDYTHYEGLRTNLAVMRNYLSAQMNAPQLRSIAEALGTALANDRLWKRPFTRWLNSEVANVEGVGAGEMYKYLMDIQHKPALLQQLRVAINSTFGFPDRNWGLPALETTPFGPAELSAPLAAHEAGASPGFVERYLASSPGSSKTLAL